MSFVSEILSDSPSVFYDLGDLSGTVMTDSSGNARHGTLSGTYTLGATSLIPSHLSDAAISWTNGLGTIAYDAAWLASVNFSAIATFKCPATMSGVKGIIGRFNNTNSTSRWAIRLNNNTVILSRFLSSGSSNITIATGLVAGDVHHVGVNYDGTAFRVFFDGAFVSSTTVAINVGTPAFYVGKENTAQPYTSVIDAVAYFDNNVLADARFAAYYAAAQAAAASGTGSITLSGSGDAAGAAAGSGSIALSGSGGAAAPAGGTGSIDLSGAGVIDFQPATGDGSITLSGTGGAGIGASGSGTISLDGSGAAGASEAAAGTGSIVLSGFGSATLGTGGFGSIELSGDGAAMPLFITDTSRTEYGRIRSGYATVLRRRPVVAPPASVVLAPKYDLAVAYPTPVVDNGRAT